MLFVFDSWHEYTLTLFGVDGIVDLVIRRDGRVAEGAPLLRAYTLIAYRGFESLSLRHIPNKNNDLKRNKRKVYV